MPSVSNICVICGGLSQLPSRVCNSAICQARYRNHLQQGGRVCVVCGCPVHQPQNIDLATCTSVECQRHARGQFALHTPSCPICGIHVAWANQLNGSCDEPYCREQATIQRAAKRAQHLLDKREKLEALAVATYRSAQASEPSAQPIGAEPIPIVVPANLRHLTSPPPERVAILRDYLRKLANAVVVEANDLETSVQNRFAATGDRESAEALEAEQADTHYDTLVGQACSTCLGFCCFAGREHAFLKHSDISRTMHDKQLTDVESIVDDFLSYIPEQSVENSCLFHGAGGCGMPRRMRSDMCNTTLCPSLVNLFQKSVGQSLSQPYLFAATNLEDDLEHEPKVFQIKLRNFRHG